MFARNLLALSAVLIAVAAARAQDAGEAAFWDAYRAKDWKKAIDLCQKFLDEDAANTGMTYNMACLLALDGRPAEGVKWLEKAVDLGFDDAGLAQTDADLAAVRAEADFARVLEKIKANADRSLADFRKQAESAKLLILAPDKLDSEKPAPVIVALHPYGGTAAAFAELWKATAQESGAILVAPEALLKVGEGFQWGTDAQADILLQRALKKVRESYKVDDSRIVLTGFSQGAQMTFSLGMRHADVFCGLIPVAGRYQPQAAPPREKKEKLPKVFIMVGANDDPEVVAYNRLAQKEYAAAGMDVALSIYPKTGHTFPAEREAELRKALQFVLGGR